LDYVVHINNGSGEARPIVLGLLPGEETIFNLKVINHGAPSNISLEASDPLIKAVRLKRPDHYVVMEENIPIMARMPESVDRLEGKIILTSNGGSNSVPISLINDSESNLENDPNYDSKNELEEHEGYRDYRGDAELSEAKRAVSDEDEDGNEDIDYTENKNGWDGEDEGVDRDKGISEDEEIGENEGIDEIYEDDESAEKRREPEEEAERIRFSRHKDLQSYRGASRSTVANLGDSQDLPDTYREPSAYNDYGRVPAGAPVESDGQVDGQEDEAGPEPELPEHEANRGLFSLAGQGQALQLQVVPAVILVSLVAALVLTFYTGSIPEFPGALASSILIVTLIIYGAATLLKA
jgi:hypothetical protein